MIHIDIPGRNALNLEHIVLDFNGTLAVDGVLLPGVKAALNRLAGHLMVHVLTADTFGKSKAQLEGVACGLTILPPGGQDTGKRDFVEKLGADRTVAVGNGRNDRLMLAASALGIAVILGEGACGETLQAADVVCTDIIAALDLLLNPLRLVATLRS